VLRQANSLVGITPREIFEKGRKKI